MMAMGMLLTCCGQQAEPEEDPTEDVPEDISTDYEYIPELENAFDDMPDSRDAYTEISVTELEELFDEGADKLYPYWNKYVAVSAYIQKPDEDDASIGEEMDVCTEPIGDDPEYAFNGSFEMATQDVIEQLKNYSGSGEVTLLGKLVTISKDEGYTVYVNGIEER